MSTTGEYTRRTALALARSHNAWHTVTTDFRDVFAEIVVRHMGVADARPVFPGYPLDASKFPGLFA